MAGWVGSLLGPRWPRGPPFRALRFQLGSASRLIGPMNTVKCFPLMPLAYSEACSTGAAPLEVTPLNTPKDVVVETPGL